jgi:lipid A disaccharide synthetase
LINIFFGKLIIPEFLFNNFTYKKVLPLFRDLVEDKFKREEQIKYLKVFSSKMLIKNKNPAEIIADSLF